MVPSKPTAIARLQTRVAELEKELEQAQRRVSSRADYLATEVDRQAARAKKAEAKLQFLKNMAETAEEDLETGADYYDEPVVSVAHLRRKKLI